MTHAADFSLSYPDAETAVRIERSVRPEVGDIQGDRTTATLDREGAELTVSIEAEDLVALRAGLNTWLTLVGVAETAGGLANAGFDGREDGQGASDT
ncbi:KEOPS complex subunit Pcc1 [Halobacteriales archaeon Cl-PHB]